MKRSRTIQTVLMLVAVLSLVACLSTAIAVFLGSLTTDAFKTLFLAASVVWFGVAGFYALQDRPNDGV